jgi:hypothetical protein
VAPAAERLPKLGAALLASGQTFPLELAVPPQRTSALPEKVLQFGRECLASTNWGGDVPLVLVAAHRSLAKTHAGLDSEEDYWKQPEVWREAELIFVVAAPTDVGPAGQIEIEGHHAQLIEQGARPPKAATARCASL